MYINKVKTRERKRVSERASLIVLKEKTGGLDGYKTKHRHRRPKSGSARVTATPACKLCKKIYIFKRSLASVYRTASERVSHQRKFNRERTRKKEHEFDDEGMFDRRWSRRSWFEVETGRCLVIHYHNKRRTIRV